MGAPLIAFTALGYRIFAMSHTTAILPLAQAVAYLEGSAISASISKNGTVYATIYDYCYRSVSCDSMNFWSFIASQEVCKLGNVRCNENQLDDTGSIVLFLGVLCLWMLHCQR